MPQGRGALSFCTQRTVFLGAAFHMSYHSLAVTFAYALQL